MYATALQVSVVWQRYMEETEPDAPYAQKLKQLYDKLGEERLRTSIHAIPNNPEQPYDELAINLPILDAFYTHPHLFEEINLDDYRDAPENLYADGERAVIQIDGQSYRYWIDSLPQLTGEAIAFH
ncbi:hypothetical protein IQ268_16990 [Oculatella sp. LEGE 06141]|uniref:hypothetical protein n=1 Tax=Oculatella sp. LEGE 06141 TaxID=1828648 RepID=UPI00187F5A6E|nr:hypothetical protein [Oculatella sp. LEGE 06141]MBE9180261.1 hypothetical protein [Oculatella sp. LEGE 06141]